MEMSELAALQARVAILEAGLRAALRMHPIPEEARDEIWSAADVAMAALGATSDRATTEHQAAIDVISQQATGLVEVLEW